MTFIPIMVPLLVAMAVGPLLSWKRGDLFAALQRLKLAFAIAAGAAVVVLALTGAASLGAACGMALAAWVLAAVVVEWAERIHLFSEPLGASASGARCACRAPPGA